MRFKRHFENVYDPDEPTRIIQYKNEGKAQHMLRFFILCFHTSYTKAGFCIITNRRPS